MRKATLVELLDAGTIFRRNDCPDDAACRDENAPGHFIEIGVNTLQAIAQIFTGDYGTQNKIKRFCIYGPETEAWGCDALEVDIKTASSIDIRYGHKEDGEMYWFEIAYSGSFVIHWDVADAA